MILLVVFASCSNENKKTPDAFEEKTDSVLMAKKHNPKVEVYNFYKNDTSANSYAITKNSKLALQENFQKEIASGSIKFFEVDVNEEQNQELVKKFESTGLGLYILSVIDGEEQIENLTEFAELTALENTEVFKKGIVTNLKEKFRK